MHIETRNEIKRKLYNKQRNKSLLFASISIFLLIAIIVIAVYFNSKLSTTQKELLTTKDTLETEIEAKNGFKSDFKRVSKELNIKKRDYTQLQSDYSTLESTIDKKEIILKEKIVNNPKDKKEIDRLKKVISQMTKAREEERSSLNGIIDLQKSQVKAQKEMILLLQKN